MINLEQLLILLRNPNEDLKENLSMYHENDIAVALGELSKDERLKVYKYLDFEFLAEVFSYFDDAKPYFDELDEEKVADIISNMDVDDAIDALEDLNEDDRSEVQKLLDTDIQEEIEMIDSYEEDEIGNLMTTNYNVVSKSSSIKDVMRFVVKNAAENTNINIIYVVNDDQTYYGAIHLRDLIIARFDSDIEDIIKTNYPVLHAHDKIDDVLEELKDYSLDYLPVLNEQNEILGIITNDDIIQVVDKELSEDYSKLAGLTEEITVNSSIFKSIGKRIPWLLVLLVFDLFVSSIISGFENLIAVFPLVAAFQSLILDMSGNAGTQSLAVTILGLSDTKLNARTIWRIVGKEVRIGFLNGLIAGSIATLVVGVFIYIFKLDSVTIINKIGQEIHVHPFVISGIIGSTLVFGMTIASFIGCIVPITFKKIKIDPSTASGPFITSLNDIITVFLYFGIVMLFFLSIKIL